MIIQTSNEPLLIEFDEDIKETVQFRITLWDISDNLLKEWTNEDLKIVKNYVTAPLTQEETQAFPIGVVKLEIKWIDESNTTQFAEEMLLNVLHRNDTVLLEVI